MRIIVGYGNELRGEDAFGGDVIKELEKKSLQESKLISTFLLTPELLLELFEADEIIFIDAAYSEQNQYALASLLLTESESNLSYNLTPQSLMQMLKSLYDLTPKYLVYSLLTNSFERIGDQVLYKGAVLKVVQDLDNSSN
jgi:hydrogenase maturation protease